jgi:hypothetical protein
MMDFGISILTELVFIIMIICESRYVRVHKTIDFLHNKGELHDLQADQCDGQKVGI